jgi:hypothetical protein
VEYAQRARAVVKIMEETFKNNPTAEECAQAEADLLDEVALNG